LDNNTLELQQPPVLNVEVLDVGAVKGTRAVVLSIAGLAIGLTVPLPGCCALGNRSLQPHIDALEQPRTEVHLQLNGLRVCRSVECESDVAITFVESGDTVTENVILAAIALSRGVVQTCNASRNYMVQDLCLFLERISGVTIERVGSSQFTIYHCESRSFGPVACLILEDPIESSSSRQQS
jgi:UDP-N-acetylglucosamine 1-carboxyvinyltransferase